MQIEKAKAREIRRYCKAPFPCAHRHAVQAKYNATAASPNLVIYRACRWEGLCNQQSTERIRVADRKRKNKK